MPAANVVWASWSSEAGIPRFQANPAMPTISMENATGMRANASASRPAKARSVSVTSWDRRTRSGPGGPPTDSPTR